MGIGEKIPVMSRKLKKVWCPKNNTEKTEVNTGKAETIYMQLRKEKR